MNWNKNNRACTATWSSLRLLQQLVEKFDASATLKVDSLFFWQSDAPSEFRRLQAETLALQMDNVFRRIKRARYESGTTREKAVTDMVNILTEKEKTIADLAAVNDMHYLFWSEENE